MYQTLVILLVYDSSVPAFVENIVPSEVQFQTSNIFPKADWVSDVNWIRRSQSIQGYEQPYVFTVVILYINHIKSVRTEPHGQTKWSFDIWRSLKGLLSHSGDVISAETKLGTHMGHVCIYKFLKVVQVRCGRYTLKHGRKGVLEYDLVNRSFAHIIVGKTFVEHRVRRAIQMNDAESY